MKTWTILSGKGGAGKTTITATFAQLMKNGVMADCDVDAADLALILKGKKQYEEKFFSGKLARIDQKKCTSCGKCMKLCRFDAISEEDGKYTITEDRCEGCGVCVDHCPEKALEFNDHDSGMCYHSETESGPLIHARLHPGGDNSGKLVTRVKEMAEEVGEKQGRNRILIDGPPGIGCPVLASLNLSEQVLIVTEPTPSGLHDMKRLSQVLKHFKIPGSLCVNKADINGELTSQIRSLADDLNLRWLGEVPFDPAVPAALREGKTPLEAQIEPVHKAIQNIWEKWNEYM